VLFNNSRAALRKIPPGFDLAQPPGFYCRKKKATGWPGCPLGRLDLINPKRLLNGYKLKAGSIYLFTPI